MGGGIVKRQTYAIYFHLNLEINRNLNFSECKNVAMYNKEHFH